MLGTRGLTLRAAALLSMGALGLHELRYLLAFGDDAAAVSHAQGHSYLGIAAPVVGLTVAIALGSLIVRRLEGVSNSPNVRLRHAWPLLALALLAIYSSQELLEGAVVAEHPAGVAGVVGDGGWVSIPLAVAIGGVVAMLLKLPAAADELECHSYRVRSVRIFWEIPRLFETRFTRRLCLELLTPLRGRAPPAREPLI